MAWLDFTKTLVDACNATAGWSSGGTGNLSITDASSASGQSSALRLTATGANTTFYQSIKTITPTDYLTGWYMQWIRLPNQATANNVGNFFWRDPFSSNGYYQRLFTINSLSEETICSNNEWFPMMWLGAEMNAQAPAPAYNSNATWFDRMYLRATNITTGGIVDFGEMHAKVKQSRPIVCFTFDDSNDTDYTIAFPYLQSKGIKGTTYTIAGQIGLTNFLTTAQLHEMQDAGWTVGCHGDFSYTTLTNQQLIDDLNLNKSFLITNGYVGWTNLSYPLGDFNPATVATIKNQGFKTGRTVIAKSYPLVPERGLHHLQGEGSNAWTTAADGIASIDSAVLNGGTLIIFTHRLQALSGATHTSETIWKAVVDYAVTLRNAGTIDIMSMDELQIAAGTATTSTTVGITTRGITG